MEKPGSHVTPKRRPAKGYAPAPEAPPPLADLVEPSVQQTALSDAEAATWEAENLHIQKTLRERSAEFHRRVGDFLRVGPGSDSFSDREQKILHLIGEGKTDDVIASALGISEDTAQQYICSLLAKIGVANRTQAAIFAINYSFALLPNPKTGSESDYAEWVAREAATHTEAAINKFSSNRRFTKMESARLLKWCALLISNEAAFWDAVPGSITDNEQTALMMGIIPKLSKRHQIAQRQLEDPLGPRGRIIYARGERFIMGLMLVEPTSAFVQWNNDLKYFPVSGAYLGVDTFGLADYTDATDADFSGATVDHLLPKINALAAEMPKAGRARFIRTVKLAAAVAFGIENSSDVTLRNRKERYAETRIAYEKASSDENAAALRSAIKKLRSKQRELKLAPEPADLLVSRAASQLRPSTAKPLPPGKAPRGRPRVSPTH